MGRVTVLDLVLGVFRLVLGVFALLWLIGADDATLVLSAPVIWLLVLLFCIYALLVAGLTQQRPSSANVVYGASAFLDLAFVTFLVHVSGGVSSPFCATYVLIAAIHTLYFGLGFGLVLGTASSALCLLALWWADDSHLPSVKSAYYVVLPLLTAFCAGVVRARRDATIREACGGPADASPALARRMLALHALTHASAPAQRLVELLDGLTGAMLQSMGLSAYACLVADEGGRLRCVASRGLGEDAPQDGLLPADLSAGSFTKLEVHPAREGLGAALFDFPDHSRGSWACAPIRAGEETIGLLIAASDGSISPDMLSALTEAADQVAIDIRQQR